MGQSQPDIVAGIRLFSSLHGSRFTIFVPIGFDCDSNGGWGEGLGLSALSSLRSARGAIVATTSASRWRSRTGSNSCL